MSMQVRFSYPMVSYEGENIKITPLLNGENLVYLIVYEYDKDDAEVLFKKKINPVVDVLVSYLWTDMHYDNCSASETITLGVNKFIEQVEININDEIGVYQGYYYLSKNVFNLLEKISGQNQLTKQINVYLAAARVYKNGIRLEDLSRKVMAADIEFSEVVMVNYMSSLEILSAVEEVPKKQCVTCGQVIYSISKRVKNLASKTYGDGHDFVKHIVGFYQGRSKFLHEGVFNSANSYMGKVIPQLSDNDDGVEHQRYYFSNLRFQTGRVFYWVLDNVIAEAE
jgi:hypothetical protein